MDTIIADSLYQQVVSTFEERGRTIGSGALSDIRRQAFDHFQRVGFPTVKNEDWKYTNIHRLVNKPYLLDSGTDYTSAGVNLPQIPGLEAYTLVVINGHYNASLSSVIAEKGVKVSVIQDAFDEPAFQKSFAQHADKTESAFVSLNTALFTSGVFVHLEKNIVLSKPIHIVHVTTGDQDIFTQTRNLYAIEQNAEVEIIETFVARDNRSKSLNNNVTEIVLAESAKVQHYYLQKSDALSSYVNHTEVYQEKYSLYNNYNCNFPGASFIRHDINVRLDDENVESHLYGINLTADDQFVDNHTVVDHMKPNCESYEWYKNITQDSSTAVFNGKIFVREDAQKTNAFQQNNNLLLGEKSAVYTKPQLEIFADDVKCSHGCTMGQFDEDALFYLRARGIGEEAARTLLVHAFAFDVTTRFSNDEVREYVEHLVEKGLNI